MKNIFFLILVTIVTIYFVACSKIEKGFLSENVAYKDKNILCKRGLILVQSDKINADGSTPPFTFKMKNLRKQDGSPAPEEFNKEYEILVFKKETPFNAETDTTVALLNAKRELIKVKPMEFNEVSGQLSFNKGSANLPIGIYPFDVEMTNVHGTKLLPSIGQINVQDPQGDDLFQVYSVAAAVFLDGTNTSATIKNPRITCTKQSNQGARAIMKIVDKNGRPFNPKAGEVVQRGDRPRFENYAKFNPVITTDTALICDFEVAPFPLAKYVDATTDWGHLMYYRIPSTYVNIDGYAAGQYSANPRWDYQLKLEGTYVIEVRLTDAVHR